MCCGGGNLVGHLHLCFCVQPCFEYFRSHYLVAVTTVILEKVHQEKKKHGVEEVKDGGKVRSKEGEIIKMYSNHRRGLTLSE